MNIHSEALNNIDMAHREKNYSFVFLKFNIQKRKYLPDRLHIYRKLADIYKAAARPNKIQARIKCELSRYEFFRYTREIHYPVSRGHAGLTSSPRYSIPSGFDSTVRILHHQGHPINFSSSDLLRYYYLRNGLFRISCRSLLLSTCEPRCFMSIVRTSIIDCKY